MLQAHSLLRFHFLLAVALSDRKSSEGSSWKDSTETETSTTGLYMQHIAHLKLDYTIPFPSGDGSPYHAVTKHREISAGDEASKYQADTKTGWQRSLLPTIIFLLKICMSYRFFPLYLHFLPTIIFLLKICMIYCFFPYFLLS